MNGFLVGFVRILTLNSVELTKHALDVAAEVRPLGTTPLLDQVIENLASMSVTRIRLLL